MIIKTNNKLIMAFSGSTFQAGAQTSDNKYFVCTGNTSDPAANGSCQEVAAKPGDITTYYTCSASGNGNYNCTYTGSMPLPLYLSILQTATITNNNGNYVYTPTGSSNVINTVSNQSVKSYAQWSPSKTSTIVIWVIIVLIILYVMIAVNKKSKK